MKTLQRFPLLAAIAIGAALTGQPLAAERGPWQVRLAGIATEPGGGSGSSAVELESGFGFAAGFNYRASERFGLELAVIEGVESDVRLSGPAAEVISGIGGYGFTAVSAGLNLHFASSDRLDVYAGPLLAWVTYSNLDVRLAFGGSAPNGGGTRITIPVVRLESDLALGAVLGVDAPFGSGGWALNSSIRWLETGISGSDLDFGEIDFDPLIVGLGFSYRF